MPPSFKNFDRDDYKIVDDGSNPRVLGLLSLLVDVRTKQPVLWEWGGKSERAYAKTMFQKLSPGDIVIMDRGYFSKQLISIANKHSIKIIMRIKRQACNEIKRVEKGRLCKINGVSLKLCNVKIKSKRYLFLSNIMTSKNNIGNLYKSRWSVEIVFKQIKHSYKMPHNGVKTQKSFTHRIGAILLTHWAFSYSPETCTSEFRVRRAVQTLLTFKILPFLEQNHTNQHLLKLIRLAFNPGI